MKLSLRLLALLMLVSLSAQIVTQRGRARAIAHENRQLLDRWARVRNEVRALEGEVVRLRRSDRLLAVAQRIGIQAGSRKGEVRRAPRSRARNHE